VGSPEIRGTAGAADKTGKIERSGAWYTPAHKQHDIASSKPLGSAVTPKFRRFRSADEGALFWVFPLIS
jgi:hypothetical protein